MRRWRARRWRRRRRRLPGHDGDVWTSRLRCRRRPRVRAASKSSNSTGKIVCDNTLDARLAYRVRKRYARRFGLKIFGESSADARPRASAPTRSTQAAPNLISLFNPSPLARAARRDLLHESKLRHHPLQSYRIESTVRAERRRRLGQPSARRRSDLLRLRRQLLHHLRARAAHAERPLLRLERFHPLLRLLFALRQRQPRTLCRTFPSRAVIGEAATSRGRTPDARSPPRRPRSWRGAA